MPGEEVGQVERAELGFVQPRKLGGTGEELVAVRARQAPYAWERGEQRVERAAGAAVGVRDEDGTPSGRRGFQARPQLERDAIGAVVQVGR